MERDNLLSFATATAPTFDSPVNVLGDGCLLHGLHQSQYANVASDHAPKPLPMFFALNMFSLANLFDFWRVRGGVADTGVSVVDVRHQVRT